MFIAQNESGVGNSWEDTIMRLFTENRVLNSQYQHLFEQPKEKTLSPNDTFKTAKRYWNNLKHWVGGIFHKNVDHSNNVIDSEITVECLAIK